MHTKWLCLALSSTFLNSFIYYHRSTFSTNSDGRFTSNIKGVSDLAVNTSQRAIPSNNSNYEVENITAELARLNAENKELTSNKYAKNVRIIN